MKQSIFGLVLLAIVIVGGQEVRQQEVLPLGPERLTITPLGLTPDRPEGVSGTPRAPPPSIEVTQALLKARSATVSLSMCKHSIKQCQSRLDLLQHAAKVSLENCVKERDAAREQANGAGTELGEAEDPAAEGKALEKSVELTQALLKAQSATVTLSMCKKSFKHCQSRLDLGQQAAKVSLEKCVKERDAAREQANGVGTELGEAEDPAAEGEALKQASQEAEKEAVLLGECKELATRVQADMQSMVKARSAEKLATGIRPGDCAAVTKRMELTTEHKCCQGAHHSGCPLTPVRGRVHTEALHCEQFRPKGMKMQCHYSHVEFDKTAKAYRGNETVSNEYATNFVECTSWEQAQNLQVIRRFAHVGAPPVGGDAPEVWKDWHSDDDFVNLPDPINRTTTDLAETELGEPASGALQDAIEGTTSTQPETLAAPVTNHDLWSKKMATTTTILVDALVAKSQQCLRSRAEKASKCSVKKTVQCQKICFLIGDIGIGSQGDLVWSQGFTAQECPTKQKVVEQLVNMTNVTLVTETANMAWRVPKQATLTAQPTAYSAVTLETVADLAVEATTEEQRKHYLQENYNSEDLKLQRCCFPGCHLPRQVLAGKFYGTDNPWYWYDSTTPLGEAASMQFAFN